MAISINKEAMKLVRNLLDNEEKLGVSSVKLPCGATVVDMGIESKGSYEAGLLYSQINMGNLATVQLGTWDLDDVYSFSAVEVFVSDLDHSVLLCQLAGWPLESGQFAAIGSGPARAKAKLATDPYMKGIDYVDTCDETVMCIQGIRIPTDAMAVDIAQKAGVKAEDLYLLVASNASIVGAMQIAARSVEQIYHKLFFAGFPKEAFLHARGIAPIPPLVNDQTVAMGRINDSITYGAHSEFWMDTDDIMIKKIIHRTVAITSSPYYPEPFQVTFENAEKDFFNMDPEGDAGARVTIHNVNSGNSFTAGVINKEVIRKTFLN